MNIDRKQIITQGVLRAANNAAPYMLRDDMVLTTINFSVRPKVTLTEFEEVLRDMEARALITHPRTEEGLKIKITDEGRAELLQ